MKFDINIQTEPNGNLIITDYSYNNNQYFPEEQVQQSLDSYKYSECKTVNVLTKIMTTKQKIINIAIQDHTYNLNEQSNLEIENFVVSNDGYYTVTHIIIPTMDWYNNTYLPLIQQSQFEVIYTISSDNKFYKLVNNEFVECTIEEIIERNANNTTIKRVVLDVFYMEFLQQCYLRYCKNLFENVMKPCDPFCKRQDLDNDFYIRDLLWMVINVITYHINFEWYMEAQRVLEITNGCGNFCNQQNLYAKSEYSCGCS